MEGLAGGSVVQREGLLRGVDWGLACKWKHPNTGKVITDTNSNIPVSSSCFISVIVTVCGILCLHTYGGISV